MKTLCPTCRANINCTAGLGLPSPGDHTICVYCRTVSVFTESMGLELYKTWEQLDGSERSELHDTLDSFLRVMNRENN